MTVIGKTDLRAQQGAMKSVPTREEKGSESSPEKSSFTVIESTKIAKAANGCTPAAHAAHVSADHDCDKCGKVA